MSDQNEEAIFVEALEKPPAERVIFLDRACEGNPDLRKSVESLLDAYQDGSYLEPVGAPANDVELQADETGQHVGPYKLLEKIGEGGMGVVYMAEQRRPIKRRVALKIIKLGMDTKQVVARFEAERQALAMMDHPNIAKVFEAGATGTGRPYFVMELVRGIRITEYCDRNRLSIGDRLKLFTQICHAVQHAHQKGIIHRDIKPSNILVTLHDGVPVPKVIDFGIAKATQAKLTEKTLLTRFHQMIGTPAYMSPEQAEMSGLDIDTRSDIYSLGILLYELLTGKTPLDAVELLRSGYDEMRRRIKEEEPLTPSKKARTLQGKERATLANHRNVDAARLGSELKGDLDWIVMKAMAKDRTRRYETANGLAMDIQRHMANETVLARPPSARYRLQKLVWRNKFAFTAIGSVTLALLLGAVGSTWEAIRASRAEREQVLLRQLAQVEAERANREADRALEVARQMRRHAYAAHMRAADVAMRENNLGYARSLLERYFPTAGEEELRGVEWRYLWQASRSDELKTFSHDTIVSQAVFSPDGRLVATASFDGVVRVWEISSGQMVKQFDGYDGNDPNHPLAFSPNGNLLAYTHADSVILCDTFDWEVLRKEEGSLPVFSPAGQLAIASGDEVRVFDVDSWQRRALLPIGFALRALESRKAFSADSLLLAVSSRSEREIQVWSVDSQRPVAKLEPADAVSLAFAPQGRWLAVGDAKGFLAFWDLETQHVAATHKVHTSFVEGLAYSPDGNMLATGGADQLIHIWGYQPEPDGPPRLEKLYTLKGHGNEIWSLDFSRDGRFLVSAGKDGTAKVWPTVIEQGPTLTWEAGSDQLVVGFSADGTRFYSLGADRREVCSWNIADLELVRTFVPPPEAVLRTPSYGHPVRRVHGDTVLLGTNSGTVQMWDLRTGRMKGRIRVGKGTVFPLGLSPDERLVFVWDVEEHRAGLWNFQTGAQEAVFAADAGWSAREYLGYVAFSPDGRYLAYPASNYQVKMWDIGQRRDRFTFKAHKWLLNCPEFSPDSKLLATSSWDGDAVLWDLATCNQSVPTLRGHLTSPSLTVFSSDGRTLITSAGDGMVHFWNVATGQQMLTLQNAELGMLSPDGNTLIWRHEGKYRVLRLPTLAEIDSPRNPTNAEIVTFKK